MKNSKHKLIATALFLSIAIGTSAQIFSPDRLKKRAQERAEQKAEEKVNSKVDSGVDKLIDGLFGAVDKSVKKATTTEKASEDKSQEVKTSQSSSEPSQEDAMNMLSGLLGGMGKSAEPQANYEFRSSYTMKLDMNEKSGKPMSMTNKYWFNEDGKYMGSKIIDASDPQMKKQMSSMTAMIFDFEKSSMFTFMEMNGQKQMIGISFKDGSIGDYASEKYEQSNYTKTNQSKTIAGYSTTGYEMEQNGEKYMVWISNNSIPFITDYYKAFNKMSKSNPNQKGQFAYNQDPMLVKMIENGQMMLGMDSNNKDGEFHMEMVSINKNDPFSFSTSGFSSMMDMNKIIQDAQKQN